MVSTEERIQAALDSLERIARDRTAEDDSEGSGAAREELAQELTRLREEKVALEERLGQVEAAYRSLKEASDAVAGRLDGAVQQLDRVLEH